MADAPQHNISPGQLMVYLISAQGGLGVFGIARHSVEGLGHAGWWLVLALGLLGMAGVFIINGLCSRFNASIIAISRRVLGPIPGAILNWLILAALLAGTIFNLAFFMQIMRIFFFKTTPFPVLIAFLNVPLIYMAAKGLKIVARFDSFVYIAVLALAALMLAGWGQAQWSFLRPWLAFKPANLPATILHLTFNFSGFELLLVVYPRVRGGQLRAGLGAAALTTLVLTSLAVFCIAYFGEEYIVKQVFPLLTLVRALEVPIVERLDIYFIMIWLPAMGATSLAFFMTTQLAAVEILPRLSYRLVLVVLIGLVMMALLLLKDFDTVVRSLDFVGAVIFFGLGFIIPALLWLTAVLRGAGT